MLAGGWIKGIQGLQVDPNHPSYSGVANQFSNESPVSLVDFCIIMLKLSLIFTVYIFKNHRAKVKGMESQMKIAKYFY